MLFKRQKEQDLRILMTVVTQRGRICHTHICGGTPLSPSIVHTRKLHAQVSEADAGQGQTHRVQGFICMHDQAHTDEQTLVSAAEMKLRGASDSAAG